MTLPSKNLNDVELPSGYNLAEDSGDLVITDTNGNNVLRWDDTNTEWNFEANDLVNLGNVSLGGDNDIVPNTDGTGSLGTDSTSWGAVSTEGITVEHTDSPIDGSADGPIVIDNTNDDGKLIIGDETTTGNQDTDVNARIHRQSNGGAKVIRNLFWNGSDFELEKDGRGALLEIGKEGIQHNIHLDGNAGDTNLKKAFLSSTNHDTVGVINGHPFVVSPNGTARPEDTVAGNFHTQILGDNSASSSVLHGRYSDGNSGPGYHFLKTRDGSIGGGGGKAVQNDDLLGYLNWWADDGSDLQNSALQLRGEVDGTVATDDVPGRFVFSFNGTDKLKIQKNGQLDFLKAGTEGNDVMTADPETDTEDGTIWVRINGTAYHIPVYNT